MSDKKHIDKLFKEQFKNFEVTPEDHVWEHIESTLHKDKRKRRLIPIWWKVVGVAAMLTVLFTVGKSFFDSSESNAIETEVVNTNSSNETNENSKVTDRSRLIDEHNVIVHTPSSEDSKSSQPNMSSDTNISSSVVTNDTLRTSASQESTNAQPNTSAQTTATVASSSKLSPDSKALSPLQSNKNKRKSIADNDPNDLKRHTDDINTLKSESERTKIIEETTQTNKTLIASSKEKEAAQTGVDSTKINASENEVNAIEQAIAEAEHDEKEKEDKDDALSKRWSVAPNVAPVYFNSLGEGSPIDDQFITNTKEGEINVSYGIRGSYALNDKLRIRAGVNRVDLGYSTKNVIEFSSPNTSISSTSQLKNVTLNDNSSAFISANSISLSTAPDILFIKERGSIDQQLGFIEVPIELEYSLIENKFGLNLIGGFSTLFLSNNEIYSVQNNGNRTLLGEASNINSTSYSANFGIGVNYSLSRQLRFNLEPMFKYQINTFNDTSGDFQPFFIGVYTGLSFKF